MQPTQMRDTSIPVFEILTLLYPDEILLAGTYLKMAFHNAQVIVEVAFPGEREGGFSLHLIAFLQRKLEFLLIHGRGGHQSCFHPGLEPFGDFAIGLIELFNGLQRMLLTIVNTISQGDDTVELFIIGQGDDVVNFLEGEAHPAGVESERLGKKDKLLAIIADFLFHILAFFTHHGKIVLHAGNGAIFENTAGKGLGLVKDKLEVKPAPGIKIVDSRFQAGNFFSLDGFVCVLSDRMAGLDSFNQFHKISIIPYKYKHFLGEESSADSALQVAREHGRRREMHPVRDLRKGEGRIVIQYAADLLVVEELETGAV